MGINMQIEAKCSYCILAACFFAAKYKRNTHAANIFIFKITGVGPRQGLNKHSMAGGPCGGRC